MGFLNWKRKEVWHNSWLCHVIYIVYSTHPTPNSVKHPGPSTSCVTTLQLARFINRPKVNLDTRQSQGAPGSMKPELNPWIWDSNRIVSKCNTFLSRWKTLLTFFSFRRHVDCHDWNVIDVDCTLQRQQFLELFLPTNVASEFYHLVLEVNRRPTTNNSYYWCEIV